MKPAGTDAAGWPVWFQAALYGTQRAMPLNVHSAPRPSYVPIGIGRLVNIGVISTSARSKTVASAAALTASSARARSSPRLTIARPMRRKPLVRRDRRSGCGIDAASSAIPRR